VDRDLRRLLVSAGCNEGRFSGRPDELATDEDGDAVQTKAAGVRRIDRWPLVTPGIRRWTVTKVGSIGLVFKYEDVRTLVRLTNEVRSRAASSRHRCEQAQTGSSWEHFGGHRYRERRKQAVVIGCETQAIKSGPCWKTQSAAESASSMLRADR
jgi:hypothetical protein